MLKRSKEEKFVQTFNTFFPSSLGLVVVASVSWAEAERGARGGVLGLVWIRGDEACLGEEGEGEDDKTENDERMVVPGLTKALLPAASCANMLAGKESLFDLLSEVCLVFSVPSRASSLSWPSPLVPDAEVGCKVRRGEAAGTGWEVPG